MKQLNWATLGCGVIANQLAEAMQAKGRTLYSVANRTHQKAVEFANKYKIEKVYDSIDEVFEDENVDIIYISTPHNTHIEYLQKALKNGKNVICEKSITLNSKELDEAINLAKENNYKTIISHRSGETEDTFIADFAVGLNLGQIKTGSMSRGERICKYNRIFNGRDEIGTNQELIK